MIHLWIVVGVVCDRFHNKPKTVSFNDQNFFARIHDLIARMSRVELSPYQNSSRVSSSRSPYSAKAYQFIQIIQVGFMVVGVL